MLEFSKKTNLAWSREQIKHKYDGLKIRWALWKKLKGKETSLGWDHEKGTITASDEWWLKKIEVKIFYFYFFVWLIVGLTILML